MFAHREREKTTIVGWHRAPKRAQVAALFLLLAGTVVSAQSFERFRDTRDERDVILVDYYHRSPKFTLLGGRIRMAGMTDHSGRYMLEDRVHGNAYSAVRLVLSEDFVFRTTAEPITPQSLKGVDVLLILNPDSPNYLPGANKISDDEIRTIVQFVDAGGSLAVMANTPESVELDQVNKLMRHFGVEFERNWTPFYENEVPVNNQFLFNVVNLHYGGGCSIRVLDESGKARPQVVLRADKRGLERPRGYPGGYPDKHRFPQVTAGAPIITFSHYGQGKVLAVGDSGTWALDDTALADADNLAILKQLFRRLRRAAADPPQYRFSSWEPAQYRVEIDRLIGSPDKTILDLFPPRVEIISENFRYEFRFDFSNLQIAQRVETIDSEGVATIALDIRNPSDGSTEVEGASFKVTPQGKIFDPRTNQMADRAFLEALLDDFTVVFSDPLPKLGHSWENELWMPILPLELGSNTVRLKKVRAKHIMDGFANKEGQDCAKVITYATLDMRELDITDLVSPSLLQKGGISRFRIDEGMCILEKEQYFSRTDGRLVSSEAYVHYRVWLNGGGFKGDSSLIQVFEKVSLGLVQ